MTRLLSICALSFSIAFASGRLASAQTTAAFDVPAIVRSGLDSLKAGGFDAAIRVWMKGSPVEQSTTIDRVRGSLQPVLELYGSYVGYDILGVVHVGAHVRRTYVVMLLARGPVYAYFDCYETTSGWVIPAFLINAQPQAILPPEMLRPATTS